MDHNKGPLPLSYVADGKHSEQITGKENIYKEKSNKIRRSLVIGEPLPLPYVKVEDDNTVIDDIVVEFERKPHVKLADLGTPLPLEYASDEIGLKEEEEEENQEEDAEEDIVDDNVVVMEKPKRFNKIYDFGTPLPLDYLEEKKTIINEVRKNNDDDNNNNNNNNMSLNLSAADNVINHNLKNDIKGKEPIDEPDEQVKSDEDDILGCTAPSTEMTIFQDIIKYVEAKDTAKLQQEMQNADFRLQLMRYTRQLKKQYEYLSGMLKIQDDNIDAKQPAMPTKSVLFLLHPVIVAIMVIITLCAISYFLAD